MAVGLWHWPNMIDVDGIEAGQLALEVAIDMLMPVYLNPMVNWTCLDKLLYITPNTWPEILISGHLVGLLLTCLSVLM